MSYITVGTSPVASTTAIQSIQRYFVEYTVPALSSGGSAQSTITLAGLTTNSILVMQERIQSNSSVVGVVINARCSTANSLCLLFTNNSVSTLSGSTQSGYLLQFAF